MVHCTIHCVFSILCSESTAPLHRESSALPKAYYTVLCHLLYQLHTQSSCCTISSSCCITYNIYCTIHNVLCTVCSIYSDSHYLVHSLQYLFHFIHGTYCTNYSICTVYSLVYKVSYTAYPMVCTVYSMCRIGHLILLHHVQYLLFLPTYLSP